LYHIGQRLPTGPQKSFRRSEPHRPSGLSSEPVEICWRETCMSCFFASVGTRSIG